MARVFVSHASEDIALACELHRWLVEAGHEVFLDRDLRDGIAVGEDWEQQLQKRLRWANAMVCVVTSAYVASSWCLAEVSLARSRGNRLLPVQAEQGIAHALLKSIQHTDLTGDRVAARAALVEALRRIDKAGDPDWPDDRSPFPGLSPFGDDRHRVFFGRSREVEQLTELLRSTAERAEGAVLLVVGPSGCGKSSLVRAGLLPAMAGEPGWWRLPPIVPGADPVVALARGLAAAAHEIDLDWTVERVRHQLDEGGLTELADELLLAALGSRGQRLLIVVDQFEELLTQTGPADRTRFAELLRPALTGPVQVVGTLRPEFLDQLLNNSELTALQTRTYTLRPLRHEALRAVIEEPARLAGIGVDEHLVARLVEDTGSGDALPLLAFTLAQLADGLSRGGQLSETRYDELGGVQGALTREADAALDDAVAAGVASCREEVIAWLLRLVTVDEQGRPTRLRVRRDDELPDSVGIAFDAFIARRLLTTDTDNGSTVIGVAHEAFLTTWPPLAEAITASASALRARRAVEHAAAEWSENSRPPARLWGSGQLAAAVADIGARIQTGVAPPKRGPARWLLRRDHVLITDRVDLSLKARDFLHASIRHDRNRRGRAITILSVLLVLALVGGGIAIVKQRDAQQQGLLAEQRQRVAEQQQQIAEQQQQTATARQLLAQADVARHADPRTALLLSIAADRIHPSAETQAYLVNMLTNTRYTGTLTDDHPVDSVEFALDGKSVVTTGYGTAVLWDLTNLAQPPQRLEQIPPCPKTSWPYSSCESSRVRFRKFGEPLQRPDPHVSSAAFSRDGRTLATGGGDGTVLLWDISNRAQPRRLGEPLDAHTEYVRSMTFFPDGRTLATSSSDGSLAFWDVTTPSQPRRVGQPAVGWVDSFTFARDGRVLGITSDRTLWDLTNPIRPSRLGGPLDGPTDSVALSVDGKTLASSGGDGTVVVWDLTDLAHPRRLGEPLRGHTGDVESMVFAPDGNILATTGKDGTVVVWDLTDRVHARRLGEPMVGHTGVVESVAFSPDGKTLASGGADGAVVFWDLTGPVQPRRIGESLGGHSGPVKLAAFAGDRSMLATAGADGKVILWDISNRAQPRRLGEPLAAHSGYVESVAFARDGSMLATAGFDKKVILWDLADRAHPRQLGEPLGGHTRYVESLAFIWDGTTLATAGDDGKVILWDLADRARPRQIGEPLETRGGGFSVALTPDGGTLVSGAFGGAYLSDLTDPARLGTFRQPEIRHSDAVESVAFSPDGHTLVTGGRDRTVILWDVTDPAQPRRVGQPLIGHSAAVYSVSFSPDGKTLVSGGEDHTIILWDLTDPAQPRRLGQSLVVHTEAISSVSFSSDGNTLATSSADHSSILSVDPNPDPSLLPFRATLIPLPGPEPPHYYETTLWDLTSLNDLRAHPAKRACSLTGRGLDPAEWARYVPGLPYQDTCRG